MATGLGSREEDIYAKSAYGRNVGSKVALWQQQQHDKPMQLQSSSQSSQPTFEGPGHRVQLANKDDSYGRPVEGSKTEYRGRQAGVRISGEVIELCKIIQELGTPQPDGTVAITFGNLFEIYTRISNKLVGMLMRARKQHLVDFEGEMLFQRRDDHVVIRLLEMPVQLQKDRNKMVELLRDHPGNVHAHDHSSFQWIFQWICITDGTSGSLLPSYMEDAKSLEKVKTMVLLRVWIVFLLCVLLVLKLIHEHTVQVLGCIFFKQVTTQTILYMLHISLLSLSHPVLH